MENLDPKSPQRSQRKTHTSPQKREKYTQNEQLKKVKLVRDRLEAYLCVSNRPVKRVKLTPD